MFGGLDYYPYICLNYLTLIYEKKNMYIRYNVLILIFTH